MKLWLDDIRTPPSNEWYWARTADHAIERLRSGVVTECSLDHDLADSHYAMSTGYSNAYGLPREKTGLDVVKWMAEHNVWPEIVKVHSMNPVGAEAMRKMIARYKP